MNTFKTDVNLTTSCLLVSLVSTAWSARHLDRTLTSEVHKRHGISEKSGRYNKCVVDVDDPDFANNGKVRAAARSFLYQKTLPWATDGSRILLASAFTGFQTDMGEHERAVKAADEVLFAAYPRLKAKAKIDLNGAYNENDYPSQAELESKFRFVVKYLPVPSVNDFRVDLGKKTIAALEQQLRDEMESVAEQAMRDVWERLLKPVKNMAVQLSKPNGKVHDSIVGNIIDICKIIPDLNIADDPKLEELRKEIMKTLTRPTTIIRNDPAAKADLAKKAKAISAKMSALMGE